MSYRRIRHLNPAQIVGARGAWDARRTGLSDGRMASWPALPGSAMAAPTQLAADNTRPVLFNGVRAYAQFQASESRRLQWAGSAELDTFRNVGAGVILVAYQTGTLTGSSEPLIRFSRGGGVPNRAFTAAADTTPVSVVGGRRLDGDTFRGANAGTVTANQSAVLEGRHDWSANVITQIRQDGVRSTATNTYSSGGGMSDTTPSQEASVGGEISGALMSNVRIYAFAVLRPTSPISAFDASLRRIQQHYCLTFGIPYRS